MGRAVISAVKKTRVLDKSTRSHKLSGKYRTGRLGDEREINFKLNSM